MPKPPKKPEPIARSRRAGRGKIVSPAQQGTYADPPVEDLDLTKMIEEVYTELEAIRGELMTLHGRLFNVCNRLLLSQKGDGIPF